MEMKETLAAAGINVSEFARLCGVTRVTASTWVNKRHAPHHYLRDRVAKLLALIVDATEAGALPVPNDPSSSREARMKQVKQALLSVKSKA